MNSLYARHLQRVSRSFAFCIEELRPSLREDVALAYLLFRVLDTLEDSFWTDQPAQMEAFESFSSLLVNAPYGAQILQTFQKQCRKAQMTPDETRLIGDLGQLLDGLAKCESTRKSSLITTLQLMAEGMKFFKLEKKQKLQSLAEVNLYCYFVAGCIGELLTLWVFGESAESNEPLQHDAINFGIFLQKINILKDYLTDQMEGRDWLPSWSELEGSLREHAERAFNYCESISEKEYKIFCSWSFFLALASFPHIKKSYQLQRPHKISRLETWSLLKRVKSAVLDEVSLSDLFHSNFDHLPLVGSKIPNAAAAEHFKLLHPKPHLARFDKFFA